MLALPLLALGWHGWALAAILFNRLLDGLDGAVARRPGSPTAAASSTSASTSSSMPPWCWALPSVTPPTPCPPPPCCSPLWARARASSPLPSWRASAASRTRVYHHKSLYYLGGLTEGSGAIALFVLMCLWPAAFAPLLAYGFALLCAITTLTRLWSGYHTLR